jgi:hypothetical protein
MSIRQKLMLAAIFDAAIQMQIIGSGILSE